MTSRLAEIGRLAGLDPHNARSVRAIDDGTLDVMFDLAVGGATAGQIIAALPDVRVADGFRPARPLAQTDAETMIGWVRQVRRRLRDCDRDTDARVSRQDRLFTLMRLEAVGEPDHDRG